MRDKMQYIETNFKIKDTKGNRDEFWDFFVCCQLDDDTIAESLDRDEKKLRPAGEGVVADGRDGKVLSETIVRLVRDEKPRR